MATGILTLPVSKFRAGGLVDLPIRPPVAAEVPPGRITFTGKIKVAVSGSDLSGGGLATARAVARFQATTTDRYSTLVEQPIGLGFNATTRTYDWDVTLDLS